MFFRLLMCAAAGLSAAACGAESIKLAGATGDGETFTGIAVAGGGLDQSGTMQLVSNRGMTCLGTYEFDGLSGPKGRANLTCSDGTATVMALDMPSRTGTGFIGSRPLQFRW